MFEALTSLAQTASEKTKQFTDKGYELVKQMGVLDLEEGYNEGRDKRSEGDATSAVCAATSEATFFSPGREKTQHPAEVVVTRQLLTAPPPGWESPMEEWRLLTQSALLETNGSVIPPKRILEEERLATRLPDLLGLKSITELPSFPEVGSCVPSTEVVDWVLSSPEMSAFRSSLVPRYVVDEQYWVNISWRFSLYKMCRTTQQLLELMKVLTTEPRSLDTTGEVVRGKDIGISNSAAYWDELQKELDERRGAEEWVRAQVTDVTQEIELSLANLHLLTNIIKKRDVTELGESISESCKYHKTKLARLIGKIKANEKKFEGSCLCVESGPLFLRLLDINEALRMRIEGYATLSSGSASDIWETVSHVDDKSGSCSISPEAEKAQDTVFEAALPWEDAVELGEKGE